MVFSELLHSVKNKENVAEDEIWKFIEQISEASVNSFEISQALIAIELIERHMESYGITDRSFSDYFDIFFKDNAFYNSMRNFWSKGLINVPKRPVEDLVSQILKYNYVTQAQYLFPEIEPHSYSTSEDGKEWRVPVETVAEKPKMKGSKKKGSSDVQSGKLRFDFVPFEEKYIPMVPKLLDAVYKGDYPYEYFYDPEWLRSQIHDPNVYFRMFWDNQAEQVVGFTYHFYNPVTKGVYMGSTVIDPTYQSQGVVSHLQTDWVDELIKTFNPSFFWGEIRACDCRMQKYLEHMGFKPIVFLLDFDTGMGKRESEVIMVSYLKDAGMSEEVKIVPEIKPLADYVLNNLGIKRKFVYINPDKDTVDSIFSLPAFRFDINYFPEWDGKLELRRNPDDLLRVMVNETANKKLISAVMGRSRVRIEVNLSSQSARIFCGGLENGPQGKILLKWLDLWLRFNKLHYMDVFVSSTEPFVQAWFLKNKWECAGYFPMFFPNVVTNTPEDAVVFRFQNEIKTEKLMLSEKVLDLCNLVLHKSCFIYEWDSKNGCATLYNKNQDNAPTSGNPAC